MRRICALLLLAVAAQAADRRTSFNAGWLFHKGDAPGAENASFDDAAWRKQNVPHDWSIEGPFDPKFDANLGGLPVYGAGWYRKHFTVPASEKGRFHSIHFDGAMSNARVWLNGKELGARPYGYISFAFDMTDALQPGATNVLAVRLAPEDKSSRWYPGAGLYRNVWLESTGLVHVAHWGTYVTTPSPNSVVVRVDVRNRGARAEQVTVETALEDASGKTVARGEAKVAVSAADTQSAEQKLAVADPKLWDIDSPYLYRAVTTVKLAGKAVDRYETPFGIRTIKFDAKTGFSLNGRHLKIHGVCNHHDLGALGSAVNRRATERQLQVMKSMGVNAIRTSHNPPSPELLEFCDRLGLMVMDEAFDMWRIPKVKNGAAKFFDEWGERDLRDMIRRDRNHPSIVMWSIGNEIPEQGKADGWQLAKRLNDICHEEDPTRPTTAGFNNMEGAIKNKLADQVDIKGFNYKPTHYAQILKDHPDWILLGAETSSCVSSRGVYHLPLEKYQKHPSLQLTSYDIISPPWAYAPDPEFAAQDDLPQVAGEFVWTGFDYLGEPTPYGKPQDWPSRSSYFGIVDLAGFPKDRFYLYQSVWTKAPMVHLLPHWNWKGREGQKIPVFAYSNAGQVELFLNGRSLGRKNRFGEPVTIPVGPNISKDRKFSSKYRLLWEVPYEPGELKAVAYSGGKQVAAKSVKTAGAPARIALQPDRSRIAADGDDLSFVTVRIEDKDGNLCPDAANLVRFKVEGAGKIEAVDNGNAASVEPFQASERKAFSGMALLIVRGAASAGEIRISAQSDGLAAAKTTVTAGR